MDKTPKSMRLHIGLFGRTNAGKSTFLNLVAGQDVAIVSPQAGTTTDPVEKTMELLPVGPVVFTDTGGVDDASALGDQRRGKMMAALRRMDVAVLMVEPDVWTEHEDRLLREMKSGARPFLVVVGKTDLRTPSPAFLARLKAVSPHVIESTAVPGQRDRVVNAFKAALGQLMPEGSLQTPDFFGGAVPPGGMALLIIPVDKEAPKGRLILPQAQAVRAALDGGAVAVVARETEYLAALARLSAPPDLVVCDSQVVDRMVAETPPDVRCTTFSILLARLKGDLPAMVKAARGIDELRDGDRILIGEACSHHANEDDIGRQKIPRWLREKTGKALQIDVRAGRDWPADLEQYQLVIHCGACMLNRREMLHRLQTAAARGVPMTNYGVAISHLKGVLPRVLEPFPDAAAALDP
ncbi:MAG: [FeFe] hydrogenase H-cluster maturation GTPase HydF [Opitutae bacterium]|nr:[FeFe] hydrogenase H-cluster maturation GTPase HydF [Opitutae bacterium]